MCPAGSRCSSHPFVAARAHARPYFHPGARARGFVLVTALLMLSVFTVLGASLLTDAGSGLRMAGRTQQNVRAYELAQSAVRAAEAAILDLRYACGHSDAAPTALAGSEAQDLAAGGSVTVWGRNAVLPDPNDAAAWQAAATVYDAPGVGTDPGYVIQDVSTDYNATDAVYRIIARAQDTGQAVVVLESYFQRDYSRYVTITGTPGTDVIAIGDLLSVNAHLGAPSIAVSLGSWQPQGSACTGPGANEYSIFFDGQGGLDTFVVANLIDVGYQPGANGQQDQTAAVPGLLAALTQFRIRDVRVENPGSTVSAIVNLGLGSNRFATDNFYCINSAQSAGSDNLLTSAIGALLPALLPIPGLAGLLTPILGALDSAVGGLLGPNGLLPLLPVSAAVFVDGGGNDTYRIAADMSTSAVVVGDLGGNDNYALDVRSGGPLPALPVLIDVGGTNSYDVEGANYTALALNSIKLSNLIGYLGNSLIGGVVSNVDSLLSSLLGGGLLSTLDNLLSNLLGILFCNTTCQQEQLLGNVLSVSSDLFSSSPGNSAGSADPYTPGLCTPLAGERLSWRELR